MTDITQQTKKLFAAAAMLLTTAVIRAQGFDNADEPSDFKLSNDDLYEDTENIFNIGHFGNEIVMLAIMGLVIFVVRRLVARRQRNGCTMWVVFFFILAYILLRVL